MMVAFLYRQRLGGCGTLGDCPPRGAAGSCSATIAGPHERLHDHRVDVGGVEGVLGMIDQRLRQSEHDWFVLLD